MCSSDLIPFLEVDADFVCRLHLELIERCARLRDDEFVRRRTVFHPFLHSFFVALLFKKEERFLIASVVSFALLVCTIEKGL